MMFWQLENLQENLVIILFPLQEKSFALVSDMPVLSYWYLYLCSPTQKSVSSTKKVNSFSLKGGLLKYKVMTALHGIHTNI